MLKPEAFKKPWALRCVVFHAELPTDLRQIALQRMHIPMIAVIIENALQFLLSRTLLVWILDLGDQL